MVHAASVKPSCSAWLWYEMNRCAAVINRRRRDLPTKENIYKVSVPLILVSDIYKALKYPLAITSFIHRNLSRDLKVAGSLN